jgi:hypothetical protein
MKKIIILTIVFSFFFSIQDLYCCTSAIISGKLTIDGRPLLLKHRDTGELNNRIENFNGKKYDFIGLVNSPSIGEEVWGGTNTVGFSIINTASYNLKDDDVKEMDKEGLLMYKALGVCKNLKDFESFLDNYERPMRVEANFGIIDAEGGAAYYEVNNNSWKKFDVNDPNVAPDGYYVVTNFSFSGRKDEGMGYVRYMSANKIFSEKAKEGNITPKWVFDNISRSFYHSILNIDLKSDILLDNGGSGWFIDQDFIPRKSSSASIVFQGVKRGENAEFTIMWALLGYPPLGIAVPLFAKYGSELPYFVIKGDDSNAELCNMALLLKDDVFSIKRGNGNKYFNFSKLYNINGKGYSQQISNIEEEVITHFNDKMDKWRSKGIDIKELSKFYKEEYENTIIVRWPKCSH